MKRAVGLLVVVSITGEREYSYKMPIFAQTPDGDSSLEAQKKARRS